MKFDQKKNIQLYIVAALTALLLFLLGYFAFFAQKKSFFSVPVLTETPGNVEKNVPGDLTLCFNGLALPQDKETGLYYLSQNMNADSWQGALSLNSKDYYLFFAPDDMLHDKSMAMESGHIFTLYAQKENCYYPLSLTISGLPVISMTSSYEETPVYDENDVDNYYYNSETRVYGDIAIFNANPSSGNVETFSDGLCYHERGATSAIFPKKNYALKLLKDSGKKHSVSLFDLPESAEWKLISMFTDRTKLRDMVSLKLWKEMADGETAFQEQGADMSYCEVLLDGEYLGLYGVLYPIDEDTKALGEKDILYKVLAEDPPSESAFQYTLDNCYAVSYPVRLRYPKGYQQTEDILPYWEPMRAYLTYGYWKPDANLFSQLLDLRNVADFYIYLQTTSASDNQFKNTYMLSRYQEERNAYTTYIIPWDMNYSFGDQYIYDNSVLYTAFNDDPSVIYMESGLKQLFDENIAGANDILVSRYSAYRQNTLSTEHIQNLFLKYSDLLVRSGALARDSEKWPESRNTTDLDALLNYVEKRMEFLDGYFCRE